MRRFVVRVSVLVLLCSSFVLAADSFKKDDEVEVMFLGEWRPAVVVNTNKRGEVLADYEFAGGSQQRVFKPTEVRFAYESGAIARARQWSDASGKFKIKAALISIDGDQITLRKPDKSELTIAVAKLSDPDKTFLAKLSNESGPIAPKGQEVVTFDEGSKFDAQTWGELNRVALTPDPVPQGLKLKQGGVPVPMEDFHDSLGGLLPLGGSDSWLLAVSENAFDKPTRLVWASLAKGKVGGQQSLPAGEVVLDYHTKSKRLLTASKVKTDANAWGDVTLTIWEVLPTDKQPKPIIRWRAQPPDNFPQEPWARLLDGNSVLHRWQRQEYVVWDIEQKQLRYRVTQESFFAASACLSGSRQYLVLPEDNRIRILEAATGKLVCTLPAEGGSSGVAVSVDGTRLAVLNRSTLTVWDLTSADAAPEVYQAEAIGTPFSADLAWAGPDTIAVMGSGRHELKLFSLKLQIALWNYEFDFRAVREEPGRRLRDIVDGHLVYGARIGFTGAEKDVAVGAVKLPGPKVDEIAANTTRESLLIMKPGSPVRIEVKAGEHQAVVEAALKKEVEKNKWVLKGNAPNVLTAEMKRGETQSVTYQSRATGASQSVTVTPHVATLTLTVGDAVAWSTGTSSGAPPFISLQAGQTAQTEVEKWNSPYPKFYETVDIPDSILDPKKSSGLGTSQVTNRGLVPK